MGLNPELPTAVLLRRMADLSARGEQVDPGVLRAAADELGRTARAWQDALQVVDEQGEAVELLRKVRNSDDVWMWVSPTLVHDIDRVLAAVDRPHNTEERQ